MPQHLPAAPKPHTTQGKAPSRADLLAHALANAILAGLHPVGAELPTDADLAAGHGASLATVRVALRAVETLGLIQRERGGVLRVVSGEVRATYVIGPGQNGAGQNGAGQNGAAAADAREGGRYLGATRVLVERRRRVLADAELAVRLGAREGSEWLHLTGLRMTADLALGPLSWFDAWVGGSAPTLDDDSTFTAEALEAATRWGIAEVREEILAAPLTPQQARQLQARGGGFALEIMRRYLRGNGALVAAVRDIHPAGRILVVTRAGREAASSAHPGL